jgi:hypothetical protein
VITLQDLSFISSTQKNAYTLNVNAVNPAANALIFEHYNTPSSLKQFFYKNLLISCSAACEVSIQAEHIAGITCTSLISGVGSLYIDSLGSPLGSVGSIANIDTTCTTQPSGANGLINVFIPANDVRSIDLTGWVAQNVSNSSGIIVRSVTAITGTITTTTIWTEQ